MTSTNSLRSSDLPTPKNNEQMYAAMTFAFILIVIGMPLWWYTTQVYRVALPYDEMDLLDAQSVPAINTAICLAAINSSRSHQLAETIRFHFSSSKLYNVTINTAMMPDEVLSNFTNLYDLEVKMSGTTAVGAVQIVEVPDMASFTSQKVLLGHNNSVFFSSQADASAIIEVLETRILLEVELLSRLQRTYIHKTPSSRHFAPMPAYDVLITVLHPSPGDATVHFDLVDAIGEYMMPFVDALSDVCEIHVKSQWLHLVDVRPEPPPQLNKAQRADSDSADDIYFVLPQAALPHLITPLEKKLGSHVSARPVINLVVWVPSCDFSPLHIHTDTGVRLQYDAFISPRWGGIQIVNPSLGGCDVTVDSGVVMGVFLHQLRVLLGVGDAPARDPTLVTPSVHPLRQWEKDTFVRRRTLELLSSAKHTLKSLSQLLGKISNIVITDEVGGGIVAAVQSVSDCEDALRRGELLMAHAHAVAAHSLAEAAFTAPSLLALLYFPEDQKYAVYIPLFLPVMIPVLISFKPMREWLLTKFASPKIKHD